MIVFTTYIASSLRFISGFPAVCPAGQVCIAPAITIECRTAILQPGILSLIDS